MGYKCKVLNYMTTGCHIINFVATPTQLIQNSQYRNDSHKFAKKLLLLKFHMTFCD